MATGRSRCFGRYHRNNIVAVWLGRVNDYLLHTFSLVKLAGGAYLIFLGVSMIIKTMQREQSKHAKHPITAAKTSRAQLFINTYVVTALNPKGIVFFVAFLPQFVSSAYPIPLQLGTLAFTFVVLAALNAFGYAWLSHRTNHLIKNQNLNRNISLTAGSVLTVAGLLTLRSQQT